MKLLHARCRFVPSPSGLHDERTDPDQCQNRPSDETIDGSLCVRSGQIVDIAATGNGQAHAIDIEGDYLLPGFVDLHTDNLERHFAPRPGVSWPSLPAVLAHDAQLAAAGITTVFNALSAGDLDDDSVRVESLSEMVDALRMARERELLRVDHLTHLRCEVSHARVVEIFRFYVDSTDIRLVSVMDHTPGQRQFTRMDKYREYYQGKYGMTDEELERFTTDKLKRQEQYSTPNRTAIVTECRRRGIVLASHDDATAEHVEEAIRDGVTLSEFPTTVEAAEKAHHAGLSVLMGAPNLVLGGSHSGNVSAMELARRACSTRCPPIMFRRACCRQLSGSGMKASNPGCRMLWQRFPPSRRKSPGSTTGEKSALENGRTSCVSP